MDREQFEFIREQIKKHCDRTAFVKVNWDKVTFCRDMYIDDCKDHETEFDIDEMIGTRIYINGLLLGVTRNQWGAGGSKGSHFHCEEIANCNDPCEYANSTQDYDR